MFTGTLSGVVPGIVWPQEGRGGLSLKGGTLATHDFKDEMVNLMC